MHIHHKDKETKPEKTPPFAAVGNSGDPLNGRVCGFSKNVTFAPTATNQPH